MYNCLSVGGTECWFILVFKDIWMKWIEILTPDPSINVVLQLWCKIVAYKQKHVLLSLQFKMLVNSPDYFLCLWGEGFTFATRLPDWSVLSLLCSASLSPSVIFCQSRPPPDPLLGDIIHEQTLSIQLSFSLVDPSLDLLIQWSNFWSSGLTVDFFYLMNLSPTAVAQAQPHLALYSVQLRCSSRWTFLSDCHLISNVKKTRLH